MNTSDSWIKSVDSNNNEIITLENKYRMNAIISCADVFDDNIELLLDPAFASDCLAVFNHKRPIAAVVGAAICPVSLVDSNLVSTPSGLIY